PPGQTQWFLSGGFGICLNFPFYGVGQNTLCIAVWACTTVVPVGNPNLTRRQTHNGSGYAPCMLPRNLRPIRLSRRIEAFDSLLGAERPSTTRRVVSISSRSRWPVTAILNSNFVKNDGRSLWLSLTYWDGSSRASSRQFPESLWVNSHSCLVDR